MLIAVAALRQPQVDATERIFMIKLPQLNVKNSAAPLSTTTVGNEGHPEIRIFCMSEVHFDAYIPGPAHGKGQKKEVPKTKASTKKLDIVNRAPARDIRIFRTDIGGSDGVVSAPCVKSVNSEEGATRSVGNKEENRNTADSGKEVHTVKGFEAADGSSDAVSVIRRNAGYVNSVMGTSTATTGTSVASTGGSTGAKHDRKAAGASSSKYSKSVSSDMAASSVRERIW